MRDADYYARPAKGTRPPAETSTTRSPRSAAPSSTDAGLLPQPTGGIICGSISCGHRRLPGIDLPGRGRGAPDPARRLRHHRQRTCRRKTVDGITSLDAARHPRGPRAESHPGPVGNRQLRAPGSRDTAWAEDANTGLTPETGPRSTGIPEEHRGQHPAYRRVTEILRTLQAICRDRNRSLTPAMNAVTLRSG